MKNYLTFDLFPHKNEFLLKSTDLSFCFVISVILKRERRLETTFSGA